jgi:hypothetical protein
MTSPFSSPKATDCDETFSGHHLVPAEAVPGHDLERGRLMYTNSDFLVPLCHATLRDQISVYRVPPVEI